MFPKFNQQFNFAFIDESTKREIRRKLLKAIAIPGYQVPYSSPEMPIARGWGTGGLHVTLSIIGRQDVFKIIDQGSDASVNACNLRDFVKRVTNCETTFDTHAATLIQTRHRITEERLTDGQIMIFRCRNPNRSARWNATRTKPARCTARPTTPKCGSRSTKPLSGLAIRCCDFLDKLVELNQRPTQWENKYLQEVLENLTAETV